MNYEQPQDMSIKNTELKSIPANFISLNDYECAAEKFIDTPTMNYIAGGSGDEVTLNANRSAFSNFGVRPKLLVDCSAGNTGFTLLGQAFSHPIFLAPVAYQKLVNPEGEIATAQAAYAVEACMVTSTLASIKMEEVIAANPGRNWFQLYFQPLRDQTLKLVRQAEQAGFEAIVVTLDTPIQAMSRRAIRAGFKLPAHVRAENIGPAKVDEVVELEHTDSVIFQGAMADAPKREDLTWLCSITHLPVIVKGVLSPADAAMLLQFGVGGLVVSNHGGRALDGSPATLDVIADIRAEVGPDVPLLLDGGVRSGYDIFKAIALGANAVLIGRPQLYALAVAGALGVAHMLKLLRDELELCMAMSGCPTLKDITRDRVFKINQDRS